MLELEVGIWSFEGCVSFLGFPRPANPLAPKTENPPRRQSDHAVCIEVAGLQARPVVIIAGKIREGAILPEGGRAVAEKTASGHRVRPDRCLQRPRTVPLPAKLLRSRVYKPGPWL